MLVVKIILILTLLYTFYQDFKERKVYWFLFLIIGVTCGILHYTSTLSELFFTSVLMNLAFIVLLLLVVFLYSKFKLGVNFKDTFGLGDTLLFIALSLTFSTVSFIIVLIFSLIFALVIHLSLKSKSKFSTVPLAGYISLFFAITYVAYWTGFISSLYTI